MNRRPLSRLASPTLVVCALLTLVAADAFAQGTIGFAQKAEDQERKWVDGLSRSDLQNLAMMTLVFHPDRVEVTDGQWSARQQQRIAIVDIDFGDAELDLSKTPGTVDEQTRIRTLEATLPTLDDEVKKLKIEFLVQDEEGDTDDKRLRCKLDNRLPITSGTVELYVLEGTERSFWCRDIDPADVE